MLPPVFCIIVWCWTCLCVGGGHVEGVDDQILFKIRWKDPIESLADPLDTEKHEVLRMLSSDKEPYVCYVPRKLETKGSETTTRNYQGPTPLELLEPVFSNKVCRYKLDHYWTYQLCHGKSVRQYHEDTAASKVSIVEFYLGKYDSDRMKEDNERYKKEFAERLKTEKLEKLPTVKIDGIDYPYFGLNMSHGTLCDLNQMPRSTQVLYICSETADNEMLSFEESLSCQYKVIVKTPELCKHPDYRVEFAPENEISCHPEKSVDEAVSSKSNAVPVPEPTRLQELAKENEDFKLTSHSEEGNLEEDFKRTLKIYFLPDEDEVRPAEVPQHDAKHVQRFLNGEFCLHGGSGWWKYEFCYGKRVSQYHVEKSERSQEILLGKWNEVKHKMWVQSNPSRKLRPDTAPKSLYHFYTDGEVCEVTGRPRTVEVKLTCKGIKGHPDAVSIFLEEPKPCEYRLTVESAIICPLLNNVDHFGLPKEIKAVQDNHEDDDEETLVV